MIGLVNFFNLRLGLFSANSFPGNCFSFSLPNSCPSVVLTEICCVDNSEPVYITKRLPKMRRLLPLHFLLPTSVKDGARVPCRSGSLRPTKSPRALSGSSRPAQSRAFLLAGRSVRAHLRDVAPEPPGDPGGIGRWFSRSGVLSQGLDISYVRITSVPMLELLSAS